MDIHSIYQLASSEHRQRWQAAPVVPDYDVPNVEIQPGWVPRLIERFVGALGHLVTPSTSARTAFCQSKAAERI